MSVIRYTTKSMKELFEDNLKISIWRKLWLSLAKNQKKLGIEISDKQISSMETNINNIDKNKIVEYENLFKHDVVANIKAYSDVAPEASNIIHLGCTSAFITDNYDLILFRDAFLSIKKQINVIINKLEKKAVQYKDTTCLAYTHFQPAQFISIGKRFCLWIQDLMIDIEEIDNFLSKKYFLGVKGATGSQESIIYLFSKISPNPYRLVRFLDKYVASDFNLEPIEISSQTYTRKIDNKISFILSNIASTCSKIGNDIRLLQHTNEICEGFEENQIGSSAMPYKKNPILSERMCGISRYIISLSLNAPINESTQWLERTLDDSSNRKLMFSEMFMGAASILKILDNIIINLVVNENVVNSNVNKHKLLNDSEKAVIDKIMSGLSRIESHINIKEECFKENQSKIYELSKICSHQVDDFIRGCNDKDRH